MNSALDLLNKIFKPGQIAAITINGLISAFAVALLLWPPTPVNVIHVVGENEAKFVGTKPVFDAPPFKVKKDEDCRAVPKLLKTATRAAASSFSERCSRSMEGNVSTSTCVSPRAAPRLLAYLLREQTCCNGDSPSMPRNGLSLRFGLRRSSA
jgi:hypothetical protein